MQCGKGVCGQALQIAVEIAALVPVEIVVQVAYSIRLLMIHPFLQCVTQNELYHTIYDYSVV